MDPFAAVLDTCVLFREAPRDTLLRAAQRGLYRPHRGRRILDELRVNLVDHTSMDEANARRLIGIIQEVFPESEVRGHESIEEQMTNDPKDRHVAAAAVRCGAQVIATFNSHHDPTASLHDYDIEAQTPDEFLCNLLDLAPDDMVDIVREQARDLRHPPMTAEALLDRLARHVPSFAALIRQHFAKTNEPPDNPLDPLVRLPPRMKFPC